MRISIFIINSTVTSSLRSLPPYPAFPCLVSAFCPSDPPFASGFLQFGLAASTLPLIDSYSSHAKAYRGLSPHRLKRHTRRTKTKAAPFGAAFDFAKRRLSLRSRHGRSRRPDRYSAETFKIDLQAGRKYRVEILMEQGAPGADSSKVFKNGWSEDFLSLYWTPPGKTGRFAAWHFLRNGPSWKIGGGPIGLDMGGRMLPLHAPVFHGCPIASP